MKWPVRKHIQHHLSIGARDRSFVPNATTNRRNSIILKALDHLCHAIDNTLFAMFIVDAVCSHLHLWSSQHYPMLDERDAPEPCATPLPFRFAAL